MRLLIPFTLILLSFNAISQKETIAGKYILKLESSNALIEDTLILNDDGTFIFHEYDKHDNGIPPERNKYGKGKWKIDKSTLYFFAEESDIDEKYTLNFNNSEARFITKSLRDKSDRIIPTSLQFYKSDIFWLVKRKLIKK